MENENEIKQEQAPVEAPHTALTAVSAKKRAPRLETPAAPAPAVPPQEPAPDPNERVPVCDVQFRAGSKIYFFDPGSLTLKNGDHVIIDTARGAEYGYVIIGNHRIARRELVQPLRRVLRVATAIDERIKAENEKREKEAYAFCQRKVEELGLDMQLVSAECAFDGSKLLFFFTADARVDFRELVKILASNFHTRIELRQIGVRDKAKMLGGLGICGRPFCCASFLDDFQPVSIKMAKTQSLSLNPAKISGTCGRLMCCLKYEQDAYEDLIKTSPKTDSFVDTPDGRGTVTGVNLMRQSVNVRMEKDEEVHTYRNSEICVLRSGKAKKTDPPIPEDLAPISGRKDGDLLRERRPFLDRRLTVDPGEAEEPDREESEAPAREQDRPGEADQGRRSRRNDRADRDKKFRKEAKDAARDGSMDGSQPSTPSDSRHAGKDAANDGSRDGSQPSAAADARHAAKDAGKGAQGGPANGQAAKDSAQPAASEEKSAQDKGSRRNRKNRSADKAPQAEKQEKQEFLERADKGEKPSRQQRRRQQQGKQEPKLPQLDQSKHPAPEKRPEEQPAPKPEGKKNNKRRYYHNRKPKG